MTMESGPTQYSTRGFAKTDFADPTWRSAPVSSNPAVSFDQFSFLFKNFTGRTVRRRNAVGDGRNRLKISEHGLEVFISQRGQTSPRHGRQDFPAAAHV